MSCGFHMLMKPIGSRCNMRCSYCFYSEKTALYPEETHWKMSDELLERFVRSYIEEQPLKEVSFVWQGGEPMLMGIPFYQKAVQLQRKYAGKKVIANSIQTNGTLITEEWCRFFRQNNFLVGISLDGPAEFHDRYRSMQSGMPSFSAVLAGVRLMQRYGVGFNVTACVTQESAVHPLEIYHFFKEIGVRYIQFAPIVERLPDEAETAVGLWHAHPDHHQIENPNMQSCSVRPEDYGKFLSTIFDEWAAEDIGSVFVMNFEWALERWMGLPASYCLFGKQCGHAMAVEHNGDVYACDHFVYPDYYLGDLNSCSPTELLKQSMTGKLASQKSDLTEKCRNCDVRFACEGECPKNRFLPTEDGKGINYLCGGYQIFFRHIAPAMEKMCRLLRQGKSLGPMKNL